ncbi:MAG TPA: glycosyltransferase [Alphaproteobacteria bacterium]|nr:glycosyltransferase [Alphaproteobacteria bacterium]
MAAIAVVVKGWPRLSETFIAQELVGLEARGLTLRLYALRRPRDDKTHDLHRELKAPVVYLPEYLWRAPLRVLHGYRKARRMSGYRRARGQWLADLVRDPTPNRIRRFGQALVLAAELPDDVAHIYAHFLHTPASVARYAAMLRELPWSASAHAKDIWTTPDWEKREKIAAARWIVTCTRAGAAHLGALAEGGDKIRLIHHGLDARRFPALARLPRPRDGSDPADPAVIVSVGRAVAKKGFDVLLQALALMPPELHWKFVHIGGGALGGKLRRQATRLSLGARIDWRGALAQNEVLEAYRAADVFALASRVTENGDRDGIPNVLMEAMSQGCAVLATKAGAIGELVADGVTGHLVPPDDPAAFAAALAELIGDPARRARLAAAGSRRVAADFAHERGIDRIAALLCEQPEIAERAPAPARDAPRNLCASSSTRR